MKEVRKTLKPGGILVKDDMSPGRPVDGDEVREFLLRDPRLASAEILDDLVLLGALEDKVAVGTMNRGGLAGARWELDDRFTAYDTDHLIAKFERSQIPLLAVADGRWIGSGGTLCEFPTVASSLIWHGENYGSGDALPPKLTEQVQLGRAA